MILKINIPSFGIPLNMLYPTSKNGRRFLSARGKEYKRLVAYHTLLAIKEQGFRFDENCEFVTSEFFFFGPSVMTKNQKISKNKADTSNMIKPLEDAIFETLGVDDLYNLDVFASVRYAEEPKTIVIIRTHSNLTLKEEVEMI